MDIYLKFRLSTGEKMNVLETISMNGNISYTHLTCTEGLPYACLVLGAEDSVTTTTHSPFLEFTLCQARYTKRNRTKVNVMSAPP